MRRKARYSRSGCSWREKKREMGLFEKSDVAAAGNTAEPASNETAILRERIARDHERYQQGCPYRQRVTTIDHCASSRDLGCRAEAIVRDYCDTGGRRCYPRSGYPTELRSIFL